VQIKLWSKNEAGLKKLSKKQHGILTITKLANIAIAFYLMLRRKPKL